MRQTDVAGNTGPASSLGAVTVDAAASAPTAALSTDSGLAGDNVTNDGSVVVSGLEPGASFEYSTDGGSTWQQGTGSGFTLAEGTYTGVQVRQTDAAGNVSPVFSLGAVTVDATIAPPTVALASDTGTPGDGLTSDGTVTVGGLEPGATWEYSLDGGATWTTGSGGSFELADGTYSGVQVRSTDVAGNVSAPAALGPVTVVTGPAGDLTLALETDTGASGADGVTSDGTVLVGGLAPGATYEYSTDGGLTWQPGAGSSFELAEGTYSDVQVRQVDGAGNTGAPTSLGAVTVDTSGAPTRRCRRW
ncbi:hypothetical protein [Novosphingobium kaempferiae]|uniref:hypothetical protein n=1 Tax=Novosphingobium kaempferiae TaxID=2896849 RepID=UPI001E56E968|nr:hypothetical protein [Novosphingobium kaempferiae]